MNLSCRAFITYIIYVVLRRTKYKNTIFQCLTVHQEVHWWWVTPLGWVFAWSVTNLMFLPGNKCPQMTSRIVHLWRKRENYKTMMLNMNLFYVLVLHHSCVWSLFHLPCLYCLAVCLPLSVTRSASVNPKCGHLRKLGESAHFPKFHHLGAFLIVGGQPVGWRNNCY